MIKDQLIYVAHPFGGDKANKYSIDTIMENLVMLIRTIHIYHLFIISACCTLIHNTQKA